MRCKSFFVLHTLFLHTLALTLSKVRTEPLCKAIPGDAGWPKLSEWSSLNVTVRGRLIATAPLGRVCHGTSHSQGQCQELQKAWPYAAVHAQAPAEFLAPYFQNKSCSPFAPQKEACQLGNYAQYSINVSCVEDIQMGVTFARDKNIRLTIKNSGHDLLGKSTGKAALSLWMYNLKQVDFIESYTGDAPYTGPALSIGAGVSTAEAAQTANQRGWRVVAGTCPDVGVTGGYTAGGGHSSFTSLYGMAADNVLEWEVVSAAGEHLKATPLTNADLYWALSGGGAGTFGVVVSMTVRLYRDQVFSGARFEFNTSAAGSVNKFWDGVAAFQSALPPVVDKGAVVAYTLTAKALSIISIALPNMNNSAAHQALRPIAASMESANISVNMSPSTHPSYLGFLHAYYNTTVAVTPEAQLTGSRLVPRAMFGNSSAEKNLVSTMRGIAEKDYGILCTAVNASKPSPIQNAVFPKWRNTLLHCIFVQTWNFSAPPEQMYARQAELTQDIVPRIEAVTPGGGAYLNEANFQQPNWQEVFYGTNYPKLKDIKRERDPLGVFYARTAVGSDDWAEDALGRLCKTY